MTQETPREAATEVARRLERAARSWPYRGVHHDKGFRWEDWTPEAVAIVVKQCGDEGLAIVLVDDYDRLLRVEAAARAVSAHWFALNGYRAHRVGCECGGSNDGVHWCRGLTEAATALREALGETER